MDFDFYHDDPYCTNDFAKFFTRQDLPENDRDHFDFLTAFEVLEHFENPMEEIGNLLQLSDAVFVTTELLPEDKKTAKEIADWHYIGAEAGQHIGFFTKKALEEVGKKYHRYLYTDGKQLSLFTSQKLNEDPFEKRIIADLSPEYKMFAHNGMMPLSSWIRSYIGEKAAKSLFLKDWDYLHEKKGNKS